MVREMVIRGPCPEHSFLPYGALSVTLCQFSQSLQELHGVCNFLSSFLQMRDLRPGVTQRLAAVTLSVSCGPGICSQETGLQVTTLNHRIAHTSSLRLANRHLGETPPIHRSPSSVPPHPMPILPSHFASVSLGLNLTFLPLPSLTSSPNHLHLDSE